MEWDEMRKGEKRSYTHFLPFGALCSIPVLGVGAFAYLGFERHSITLLVIAATAAVISAAPAVISWLALLSVLQIAGSIWRTRIAHPATTKRP
jgi:hypothetical protein